MRIEDQIVARCKDCGVGFLVMRKVEGLGVCEAFCHRDSEIEEISLLLDLEDCPHYKRWEANGQGIRDSSLDRVKA